MQVGSVYYSFDFGFKNYVTLSTTGRYDNFDVHFRLQCGIYPSVSLSTVVSNYVKLPDAISSWSTRSYAICEKWFTKSTIGPAWDAINSGKPDWLWFYLSVGLWWALFTIAIPIGL